MIIFVVALQFSHFKNISTATPLLYFFYFLFAFLSARTTNTSQDQTLTPHGKRMASLPLDPIFSHLLLKSESFGCVAEALTAVSLLSSDNIFLHPHREEEKQAAAQAHKHFASKDGDLPTLLQVYNAWLKVNKCDI